MRFYPAAIALSMLAVVSSSASLGADRTPDPRAAAMVAEGTTQLEAGETQAAIDAFEAALTIDPGYTQVYVHLADAARQDGLQGKAIHFYREAQERDPTNLAAIAGEGEALIEKGAVETAGMNLTRLEELCGADCSETIELAAAIERGPPERVMTAEVVDPEATVTQN